MKLLKIHWVFILFMALGATIASCGGQENASDSSSEQMEKQGKSIPPPMYVLCIVKVVEVTNPVSVLCATWIM